MFVGLFVCRDILKWTTADISCLIDIKRTFYDGKVVWWCFSQHIARILHETEANYHVITYNWHHYSKSNHSPNADCALFKLIKCTNLDIQDSACLHVVHILQHPTSRPTTRSTQNTMVNARRKNFSPPPAGKYRKSTEKSTPQCHHANKGKSGFEAERVRVFGALRSLWSIKKLAAETRLETHF